MTRGTLWKLSAIVAITWIAYWPSLNCGFIWDDDDYVVNNAALRTVGGLWQLWLEPGTTHQYYPAVHSTYWVEYLLWGLNPAGYHAVNILFHCLNACLIWLLLQRLGVPGAWLAGAIFALHPVHVESVTWVTERKNVLSGFFYLLTLLTYVRYAGLAKDSARALHTPRTYLFLLLFYSLALLSKTVTCTLMAVIPLLWWWRGKRPNLRADLYPLTPLLLLTIAAIFINVWVEWHHVGALGERWQFSWLERCLIAGRALWFYAFKLAWPSDLTFIYPRWKIDAADAPQYLYPISCIAALALLWIRRRRWGKGPIIAAIFFIVTLSPALGFVSFYPMRFSFVADHFQYLASIGLISLVAGWVATRHMITMAYRTSACAVLVLLAGLTWRQTHMYTNLKTLWTATLARNPDAGIAHNNLGSVILAEGKLDDALAHYRQAVEIDPDDELALFNIGYVLARQKDRQTEAIDWYKKAIQANSAYPFPYYELGNLFASQGNLAAAEQHYRRAIEIHPLYAEAYNNLGNILFRQKKFREAAVQYARSIAINPRDALARNNFGIVLMGIGQTQDAAIHFRKAIELRPDFALAHLNLADLLEYQGKYGEAQEHFGEALRLNSGLDEARSGLNRMTELLKQQNAPARD